MAKITVAKSAGFCFGVKRAIDLAQDIASKNNDVYTFGPLIHNPQEVARLEKENIKIVDAACPFVKKAQDIIKELSKDSEQIVIVGEKKHPEVVALVSYGKGKCIVIEDKKDVKNVKKTDIIYIVSQTTQSPKKFEEIVNEISKISQVKVFNTICRATFDRQSAAEKLAKEVDVMIVIGGKNSGNTTRLYQICSNITKTYHIENVDEIEPAWFEKVETVGITAGASTPDWIIESIKGRIKEITNCQ